MENNQRKGANDIVLYIKPEKCFFFKGFSRRRYGGMSARSGWRWVGVVSFRMTIVADTELVIITHPQAPVDSTSLGGGGWHLSPPPRPPGSPRVVSTQEGSIWQRGRVDTLHNSPHWAQTKVKICYTHRWWCILHISIPRARHPSDA